VCSPLMMLRETLLILKRHGIAVRVPRLRDIERTPISEITKLRKWLEQPNKYALPERFRPTN